MRSETTLDRKEIERREIDRYPDERITDIPSDYMDTVKDYASKGSVSSRLGRLIGMEEGRRKRTDLRLDEVPGTKDLFKIKKYVNERMLFEKKSRRRMKEDEKELHPFLYETEEAELEDLLSDEIDIRRSHQFMEHLDTDYHKESSKLKAPHQERVEDDVGLYLMIENSEVKGIKYMTDGIAEPEVAWELDRLASEAAETRRKIREEPERIGSFGDKTFYNLTSLHFDLLDACGKDVDIGEMLGYEIEDLEESTQHLMEESIKAIETLEDIGVTYFEIEGFHTEEVASLVDHISVRDGFEVERISTHTDTDMNSEAREEFHEKIIREDTEDNNALRLFLDEDSQK